MASHRECRYLTVTNGDNVYGSEVVANVLRYGVSGAVSGAVAPNMLLAPLDSRNFAEQGEHYESLAEFRCDWF